MNPTLSAVESVTLTARENGVVGVRFTRADIAGVCYHDLTVDGLIRALVATSAFVVDGDGVRSTDGLELAWAYLTEATSGDSGLGLTRADVNAWMDRLYAAAAN